MGQLKQCLAQGLMAMQASSSTGSLVGIKVHHLQQRHQLVIVNHPGMDTLSREVISREGTSNMAINSVSRSIHKGIAMVASGVFACCSVQSPLQCHCTVLDGFVLFFVVIVNNFRRCCAAATVVVLA